MTYKSTERILFQAVETGRLLHRAPLKPVPAVRKLYVTPEVNNILDGADEKFKHLPLLETEAVIGRFCAGHLVTASLAGIPDQRPDFERLQDLDEVWALCARRPKMWQIRIFGRFISKGTFVALGLYERVTLGLRVNYSAVASDIPGIWNETLGNCVRYDADSVDDYFGGVCRDVDEED